MRWPRWLVPVEDKQREWATYLGVELLDVLVGSDICTLDGQKNVPLVGGNFDHHDEINSTNQGPDDLRAKGRFRRELRILPKL
jgi:hypothetical protein